MNQGAFERSRPAAVRRTRLPAIPVRLLTVAALFAVAFAADLATDQRYSQVVGGVAIAGSAFTLFPAIRPGLLATAAVALVWTTFNLVRAVADDAGLAIAGSGTVSDLERGLFGGSLPSATLQDRWLDPVRIQPHDVALSLVHASFFVVPFVVAALAWWRSRPLFRRYLLATALCFGFGLAAFVLLPSAPPWLTELGDVVRVTHRILEGTTAAGATEAASPTFRFEPNDLAALPSIHVAAAVLVAGVLGGFGRWGRAIGTLYAYALAMSLAVVYLGEHFVIDVVGGWLVALVGWRLTHGPRQRD